MKISKIIKLGASWCGPCRAFKPTFEKVRKMDTFKDIEFSEIDIEKDDNGEILAAKYGIMSVPTTLILDENEELIYKLLGNISEKDFVDIITRAND